MRGMRIRVVDVLELHAGALRRGEEAGLGRHQREGRICAQTATSCLR
ncbi:MAG: hypothetical protein WCA12_07260 [Burkholderiales bacterium]